MVSVVDRVTLIQRYYELLILWGGPSACAGHSAPQLQCERRLEKPPQAEGPPHPRSDLMKVATHDS